MFDIGAIELLVIGIVAIIVVGPKELPKMLRAFGQFVAKMRGMAREFQGMFEEAARDTGIDDIAKGVGDVKNFSVTDSVSKVLDPVKEDLRDMKLDLDTEAPSPRTSAKPDVDPIETANKKASETAAKVRAKSTKTTRSSGVKKKPAKKTPAAKPAAKTTG